jgi:endonuclease YncB( thermonuclease family)
MLMLSQNLAHRFFLLVLIFHFFSAGNVFAWSGQIVSVTDGDTVKVLHDGQQVKVRLYGIDTPEKKQAFGQAAKSQMQALTTSKKIDIEPVDVDRYGRTVGIVRADGVVVNGEMVKAGYAWVYEQYCKHQECQEWKTWQSEAQRNRRGLWQDSAPVPPWEWRKKNR